MTTNKSLLKFLTPTIWVSRIYGCAPFSFTEYEYDTARVKVFIIAVAYGTVLVLTSALYRIVLNLAYKGDISEKAVFKVSAILGSVATLISFISYTYYIKNVQNTYVNLLEYSKRLINDKFLRKVFWITTAEIVLSEVACIGYYLSYFFSYKDEFNAHVAELIAEHYLRYVITLFRFQFANSLLLLYSLYNLANEDFFENFKSKRLLLDVNLKKTDIKTKDVTSIISMYTEATDYCEVLNTCFSPTLAVASICMMLQVVLCCYSLVVKDITVSMFLFWLSSFVIEEWFVLYACEKVIRETKKTGVLVHSLMAQTKDPRLKEQLQQFSLQLLHRKVKFSACGLFPLNYTLIYTTAGAVTTYLVILIQFQSAANTSNCSATAIPPE